MWGLDAGEPSSSKAHAAAHTTGQRVLAGSRRHARVQAAQCGGRAKGSTLWEVRAVASTSPALRGHQGSPPEKPQGSPALGRVHPWSYAAPRLVWSLGTQEQHPFSEEMKGDAGWSSWYFPLRSQQGPAAVLCSSPALPFLSSFEPPFLGALVGKLNTDSSQEPHFFQPGPPKTF